MDSITQAALGAAIGEAILGKKAGSKGAIAGAMIATIPDLDVAFYLFYDKYEMLSIHRGYSHSILFSLAGAFLIAYILKKTDWSKSIHYKPLWLFSWLALITHMLLDAFTSYGTQLFLPFSKARISFDSINVVDPIYTLPLLIGLLFSLFIYKTKTQRPIYNYIGLTVSTFYLIGTLGVKSYVANHFRGELTEQNIPFTSLLTMPVGVANINWYGVAKTNNGLYMHKYSIVNDEQFPFEYFPTNDNILTDVDFELVDKMKWFSKGFYTVSKEKDDILFYNLQVDMRGIIQVGNRKAPTAGFFIIRPNNAGSYDLLSGAHQVE